MNETQQVMQNKFEKQLVTTWVSDNMRYEVYATPVDSAAEFISVFEYLGNKTPAKGTGKRIYEYAKSHNIPVHAKTISTSRYNGEIMLYDRKFLDDWFNQHESAISAPEPQVDEFDDDLPF